MKFHFPSDSHFFWLTKGGNPLDSQLFPLKMRIVNPQIYFLLGKDEKNQLTMVVSFFLCFLFSVPKHLQALRIANPLSECHKFYNATLNEIFSSVYELMVPVPFKNYCISQRTHRWTLQERLNQIKATIKVWFVKTLNGHAANVRKYSD